MNPEYHPAQLQLQAALGVTPQAALLRRMLQPTIPVAALPFVAAQQIVLLASDSADGSRWATMLSGAPGFLQAQAHALHWELTDSQQVLPQLPAIADCVPGQALGLLLIDLASRRRLRLSGQLSQRTGSQWQLAIALAFANCPKYIQRREWQAASVLPEMAVQQGSLASGQDLPAGLQAWIRQADTVFVASGHGQRLDCSHRGGKPGFVQLLPDGRLWLPDYAGNNMYSTLGNLAADARAGLCFPDFQHGTQLQLSGRVELDWQPQDGAAQLRGWFFTPQRWVSAALNYRLCAPQAEASPYNP